MSRRWRNDDRDGGRQVGANDIDPEFGATRRRVDRLRRTIQRRQPDLHLVLESVDDPHNVSAVLRTCDAVGVGQVHLVYSDGQFPSLAKFTSASAWKWMEIHCHTSIVICYDVLRRAGCTIIATDLSDRGTALYDFDLTLPVALVFGNEHRGLSEEASLRADANLIIPMVGVIRSLNISVACAVTLYEAMRQRINVGRYDSSAWDPETVERMVADWIAR